ncbi:ABC-type Na+ efflux pump permease subunit [Pedobacter sp. CG_S7]|uniref:hypothetical protein n=1 Tax=Pedobacter sp. CG_S7 TaxID=3143930 RepID=UPI003393F481
MTIHNILNELQRGLWYIFVSAPAEIGETGTSRGLLVLFSLVAFFQIGFWYSALLCMLFPRFRQNRDLNTISYFIVSIVAFFVCLIEYAVFENLYIGFILGFAVSPAFFNYKLYIKKH